nr:uncharacterized protein LOC116425340 [Nomia melanderi]
MTDPPEARSSCGLTRRDSNAWWACDPGPLVDDSGEHERDIVRLRVTVGPVCGATGPVCSGTVSGTKEQEETVATGPPAEACAPGGVGGAGKRRGTVLGPAEKLEAVKVASSLGLQGPSAPIGAQLLATGGSEDAPAVYHANLLASGNASVLQQPVLASLNTPALASMQASAEANSLDIQAMQSMDWLFKKERIYLLAQFWQQRATLAEKEVSALKEQLAAANDGNSKTEGHQLSQTIQGSDQQQVHDASNPRRTPNSNLEQELQAKDKEFFKKLQI